MAPTYKRRPFSQGLGRNVIDMVQEDLPQISDTIDQEVRRRFMTALDDPDVKAKLRSEVVTGIKEEALANWGKAVITGITFGFIGAFVYDMVKRAMRG